jgi:hypothetical protein
MDDEEIPFLPFHAINEFMKDAYRSQVLRSTLTALGSLPENYRAPVDRLTRQFVKVPGFRNSVKAPAPLKVKPMVEFFEKNPELVAAILSAWAEAHSELRQQVYDLLANRGWETLPPDADRTQLPGFMTTWPKGEDFETLYQAYQETYPQSGSSSDDVSLMVVWLSGRLPYETEEDEETAEGAGGEEAAES